MRNDTSVKESVAAGRFVHWRGHCVYPRGRGDTRDIEEARPTLLAVDGRTGGAFDGSGSGEGGTGAGDLRVRPRRRQVRDTGCDVYGRYRPAAVLVGVGREDLGEKLPVGA